MEIDVGYSRTDKQGITHVLVGQVTAVLDHRGITFKGFPKNTAEAEFSVESLRRLIRIADAAKD